MMDKCKAFYEALAKDPAGIWIKEFLDSWQSKDKEALIEAIFRAVGTVEGR